MKIVKISQYIYLGTNIWYLQVLSDGAEYAGTGVVKENIDSLINKLEVYGLKVSRRAAWDLQRYSQAIGKEVVGNKLTSAQCAEIRRLADELRPTINAESVGLFAYLITEKRYDTDALINDPWRLFASGVSKRLPDIAVRDIEEAAKCLAFERGTAAAFHLMRATESVLRAYYCQVVKRGRGSMMWGPIVVHLRSRPKNVDAALLDHLDGIRRNFRNPTQHPEKNYDLTEAQDLFGICIDVINRMAARLEVQI